MISSNSHPGSGVAAWLRVPASIFPRCNVDRMESQSKLKAKKLGVIVFIGGAASMFASLAFMAITKDRAIGPLVFVSAGWIVFAVMNSVSLYAGEFPWRNGPTFTKQESPVLFYISWVFFTAVSMGIATFLLTKVIQEILK